MRNRILRHTFKKILIFSIKQLKWSVKNIQFETFHYNKKGGGFNRINLLGLKVFNFKNNEFLFNCHTTVYMSDDL